MSYKNPRHVTDKLTILVSKITKIRTITNEGIMRENSCTSFRIVRIKDTKVDEGG